MAINAALPGMAGISIPKFMKPKFTRIDTHKFISSLKKDGVKQGAAETISKILDEVSNTNESRFTSKEQTEKVETKLEAKIDKLGTKIDARIDKLETRIDAKIDKLETKFDVKFEAINARLTETNRWLLTLVVSVIGLIASVAGLAITISLK